MFLALLGTVHRVSALGILHEKVRMAPIDIGVFVIARCREKTHVAFQLFLDDIASILEEAQPHLSGELEIERVLA